MWPFRSKTSAEIIAAGIAKSMKKQNSTDATIANYQNQTQQIKDMKWVLFAAIGAGTALMVISVLAPFYTVRLLDPKNTLNATTVDKLADTPGAVLPLATALVGFAGGVVTAMFRTTTTAPEKTPPSQASPSQTSQALPHAVVGPNQSVNKGSTVTLDGTQSHAATSASSIVAYFWIQTAGDQVDLVGANAATATFVAPKKAHLSFSLIIVDSKGAVSSLLQFPLL